jgi:peptidoglycan/LPS O-acetylase OafA/YrhL
MRPVKQLGMISTHALLIFAPAASAATGAALLVTHVTRFAFMFISSAMLVYAYPHLPGHRLRAFWRRRLPAVVIPYLTWTGLYFALDGLRPPGLPPELRPEGGLSPDLGASLAHLGQLLAVGYFQLYYLLILLEFYLVYPAFLWLLRRTAGHHRRLLAASVGLELVSTSLVHWGLLPAWLLGGGANKELWNYQLYLIAGGVLAWHYQRVHAWLRVHWRLVLGATGATAGLAEGWFLLSRIAAFGGLAGQSGDEPFQPVVIPLYLGLIASAYLLAVALADARRSARLRAAVRTAAANSYGIYLSHAVVLVLLVVLGWSQLTNVVPWPLVVGGAVVATYAGAATLTAILARLPGAYALTGRSRVPPRARRSHR